MLHQNTDWTSVIVLPVMKTFLMNHETYSHDKVFFSFLQLFYLKIFPIYYSNGYYTHCFAITTSTDEDNRTDSDTNLSAVDTKDKLHRYQYLDPSWQKEITAHDRISWRIPTCFWQGSLHSNTYEKKNIPYECAYA